MRRLHWLILFGCTAVFAAGAFRWQAAGNTPAQRHIRRAGQFEASGDLTAAAREWQIAAALDPQRVEAREALGKAYLADGAVALAIREFRIVTELDPRRPHAYCRAAEALQLGGLSDQALAPARYAAKAEPRCARARRTYGNVLNDREDYRAAALELEAAAKLDAGDAAVRMTLARLYQGLAQLPRAEALAREAQALQPDNPDAAHLLAHIIVSQGDRSRAAEAEPLLRAAVAANPELGPAFLDLGQVLLWKDRALAARWELERAAMLSPTDPEPLQRLAEVHAELRDDKNAALYRKRAEQVSAARLRRLEMERRLAQNPLDGRLLYQLGDFYARERQYLRAIQLLSRAADLLQEDPSVRRRLVQVRTEAGRFERVLPGSSEARS